MRKYPGSYTADDLDRHTYNVRCGLPDGRSVMARPEPFYGGPIRRIKLAWAVFTGRADALFWIGQ